MSSTHQLPQEDRRGGLENADGDSAERKLKAFRYVVASVNDEALQAWDELWNEFKTGVTPAGVVLPQMQEGFKPSCGWGEFLEKFWLLKHYLDYLKRFCTNST